MDSDRCTDIHNIRDDVVMWRPEDVDDRKPDPRVVELLRVLDELLQHELNVTCRDVYEKVHGHAPLWLSSHRLREHRFAGGRLSYPARPEQVADLLQGLESQGYDELVMSVRDRLLLRSWQLHAMTG